MVSDAEKQTTAAAAVVRRHVQKKNASQAELERIQKDLEVLVQRKQALNADTEAHKDRLNQEQVKGTDALEKEQAQLDRITHENDTLRTQVEQETQKQSEALGELDKLNSLKTIASSARLDVGVEVRNDGYLCNATCAGKFGIQQGTTFKTIDELRNKVSERDSALKDMPTVAGDTFQINAEGQMIVKSSSTPFAAGTYDPKKFREMGTDYKSLTALANELGSDRPWQFQNDGKVKCVKKETCEKLGIWAETPTDVGVVKQLLADNSALTTANEAFLKITAANDAKATSTKALADKADEFDAKQLLLQQRVDAAKAQLQTLRNEDTNLNLQLTMHTALHDDPEYRAACTRVADQAAKLGTDRASAYRLCMKSAHAHVKTSFSAAR